MDLSRKIRNLTAFGIVMLLLTALIAPYAHAQDLSFQGTGKLSPAALAQIHDAARNGAREGAANGTVAKPAIVKVPDMKAVQGLVDANGALEHRNGQLEDENNKLALENATLRHDNGSRDEDRASKSDTPWWWWLPLVISVIAFLIAWFKEGRQGRDGDNGMDGKDATVDYDKLRLIIKEILLSPWAQSLGREEYEKLMVNEKFLSALAFALGPYLKNGVVGPQGPKGDKGDPGLSHDELRTLVLEVLDEQDVIDETAGVSDGTTVVRIGTMNVHGGTGVSTK